MDSNNGHQLEEQTQSRWQELKEIIRERCDNYAARFYIIIAPSILFPLTNGVSDAMGYSIVDHPARGAIYAGGVMLHRLRNRPDIPSHHLPRSISESVSSSSLSDGIILSGVSYGIGYGIGTICDKVKDFF